MKKRLIEMNQWDIELYEYAKDLVSLRLKEYKKMVETAVMDLPENQGLALSCQAIPVHFLVQNKARFGVFQPPGHKGPL